MATGDVMVRTSKTAGVVANEDDPSADSLHCQQMEVKTAVLPGSASPQPSEMLAIGEVHAISHQADKNNPQNIVTQQIVTPRIIGETGGKGWQHATLRGKALAGLP